MQVPWNVLTCLRLLHPPPSFHGLWLEESFNIMWSDITLMMIIIIIWRRKLSSLRTKQEKLTVGVRKGEREAAWSISLEGRSISLSNYVADKNRSRDYQFALYKKGTERRRDKLFVADFHDDALLHDAFTRLSRCFTMMRGRKRREHHFPSETTTTVHIYSRKVSSYESLHVTIIIILGCLFHVPVFCCSSFLGVRVESLPSGLHAFTANKKDKQ